MSGSNEPRIPAPLGQGVVKAATTLNGFGCSALALTFNGKDISVT